MLWSSYAHLSESAAEAAKAEATTKNTPDHHPRTPPRTIENLGGPTIIILKALKCKTALEVLQNLAKNSRLSGAMAPLGLQFWMRRGWERAENLDKLIGDRTTINLKALIDKTAPNVLPILPRTRG